jgi:sucrose phosphorylase
MMKNQCQLITYPDSLGSNLQDLLYVLTNYLPEVVGGVHVLPFYPSSADRGFAPLTYFEVDDRFGSWKDIHELERRFDVICDFMVNHISRQSLYFADFVHRKDQSPYADLFIRYKDFWPGGEPSQEDLSKIYTRKPRPPYTEVTFDDGSTEKIWCTFDHEQVDFNISSEKTRALYREFLTFLCEQGAETIRLDAFAYAVKKPGTSCFFIEPEIWELLAYLGEIAAPYGVELLPEVHEHYTYQLKLAEHGFRVYDFALPLLMLHALYSGNTHNLKHWLSLCPHNQVTTLDTHDGIGVVDVVDLLTWEEIDHTRESLYERGANVKRIFNTPQYQNLDIYQINCTYYSALGNDDNGYLLARAVQFFTPGIPQVYYVGLLAGENDTELVERTKNGRDINRHNYSLEEIEQQCRRAVVRQLFTLMRFRNTYPAFSGDFTLHDTDDSLLRISWEKGNYYTELEANMNGPSFTISYWDPQTGSLEKLDLEKAWNSKISL